MTLLRVSIILLVMTNNAMANKQLDVQGHRGARAVLPENTLPAFEHALELGVDTLELDMGVSKDGVVVVSHDQDINPEICQTEDGKNVEKGLLIHQLTLAEIKSFDCGSKLNSRFTKQVTVPGTQIPTLSEVFEMVAASNAANASKVRFNIETKSNEQRPDAQPSPNKFVELVLKVVHEFDLEARVTLQSFDHRTLRAAKQQAPQLELAALFEKKPENWIAAARSAHADIVSPYFKDINAESVANMQRSGLKVIPWTANQASDWEKLVSMQVDGIITDDPEPLLKFLGRR